jgi:hypothetical protein
MLAKAVEAASAGADLILNECGTFVPPHVPSVCHGTPVNAWERSAEYAEAIGNAWISAVTACHRWRRKKKASAEA